jgi:hypothetical protein
MMSMIRRKASGLMIGALALTAIIMPGHAEEPTVKAAAAWQGQGRFYKATDNLALFAGYFEGVMAVENKQGALDSASSSAAWQDDLSDVPAVCRQENPPLDSPMAVVERIAEISTRFWLASECDRQLLVAAAAKVVAQNQQEIIELLGDRSAGGRRAEAS